MDIKKAVTLAAGRGTRMGDLTTDCPKPMLPLAGRPMLAHQIERMEEAGVEQILVVVGYKAEMVEEHFAAHPPAKAKLSYMRQEKQDGTGSATLLAREFCDDDFFLMTYGDILVDAQVYSSLFDAADDAEMAITLKHVDDPYQGAAVYVNGDRDRKSVV